jgi:hypothetical protein
MSQEKKQPSFAIVESSPQAKGAKPKPKSNALYPFDSLAIGQSFTAKLEEVNWKSLRICVYKQNAKTEKQFKFIKHDDLGLCEVARVS